MNKSISDIKAEVKHWEYRDQSHSTSRIMLLIRMAEYDVAPNGEFSDNECCIWSAIRALTNAND